MTNGTAAHTAHPLDTRIPPPVVAVITGILMWGIAYVGPTFGRTSATRIPIAIALAVSAVATIVTGFLTFRQAKTTIDPVRIDRASTLVTTGLFGVSRNPMYAALTLLLTAWAIALGALTAFAGPVLFMLYMTRFQIVPEERAMQKTFGVAYDEYRARTRRWL